MTMAKTKTQAHKGQPHKFRRIRWKSRQNKGKPYYIFKCQIPGCTHFKSRDLVVGDESECWRCGNTFQMTYASTYLAKPHCPSCTENKKEGPSVKDVEANLDKILGGGLL
jgi:hypothetical protein